jgi:hypothetical protein
MGLWDMAMRLILISGAHIVMTEAPIVVRLLSSMSTPFSLLSQQSLDTVRVHFYFLNSFQSYGSSAFPARMNSGRSWYQMAPHFLLPERTIRKACTSARSHFRITQSSSSKGHVPAYPSALGRLSCSLAGILMICAIRNSQFSTSNILTSDYAIECLQFLSLIGFARPSICEIGARFISISSNGYCTIGGNC